MNCKVCGQPTRPLWHGWHRCVACGSDTNPQTFEDVKHFYADPEYATHVLRQHGNCRNRVIDSMRTNLEWFTRFTAPAHTFLDIGTNDGCGMIGMERMGWQSWGFDFAHEYSERVEIADEFTADLFEQRFGATMCREVIEHAPDWRKLLREAHAALLPGGLFQIQTPRPATEPVESSYQITTNRVHLQLFSPGMLCSELERTGFYVLGSIIWTEGQCWMCRRVP